MKLSTKKTIIGWILAAPALLGFFLFYVYLLFQTLQYSVTDKLTSGSYVGLQNYRDVLDSTAFQLALQNTLRFYLISLPLIVIFPFLAAVWVRNHGHGTGLLHKAVFLSILIPSASLMLFVDLLCQKNGILCTLLDMDLDICNSPWAFWLLTILYLYKYGGFSFFIYSIALHRIDRSYYEEAVISGASGFQCFRYVTIPFTLPYTVVVCALALMNSYKIYREAYLIGGYYPHESIYLFQHYINNNFVHMNYSRLCCVSVLILLSAMTAAVLLYGIYQLTGRMLYEKNRR